MIFPYFPLLIMIVLWASGVVAAAFDALAPQQRQPNGRVISLVVMMMMII